MNRFLLFSILSFSVFSCSKKQTQQDNEKLILGDWVKAKKLHKYDPNKIPVEPPELPDFYTPGFSFYSNGTFDNKLGYFKDSYRSRNVYNGTNSKFKITSTKLLLFGLDSNKWYIYHVIKLTSDSLQIDFDGIITTFKHFQTKKNNTPKFDKIVIATSGCFGSCQITNTMISSDGAIFFRGQYYVTEKGMFTGRVPVMEFERLQENFRKTDFDSLKNNYSTRWTDDETITTTFVRNGKIYKTVKDYGRQAPYLFTWAYIPLEYLYQTISLKRTVGSPFVPFLDSVSYFYMQKNDQEIEFKKSETFLLIDYIRNGKKVTTVFAPRYKLVYNKFATPPPNAIQTDGRYYTFIVKGKPITIDIGFNFYDVNAKIWEWKKVEQ